MSVSFKVAQKQLRNFPSVEEIPDSCFRVNDFNDQCPLGITIEASGELRQCIEQLRQSIDKASALQPLQFEEKLAKVKEIALKAIRNGTGFSMASEEGKLCHAMHQDYSTLSQSLKSQVGDARHQAVLFFLLSSAVKLGTRHYLQGTSINDSHFSAFNEIYDHQRRVIVSLYNESLPPDCQEKDRCPEENFQLPNKNSITSYLSYAVDAQGQIHQYARWSRHVSDQELLKHSAPDEALPSAESKTGTPQCRSRRSSIDSREKAIEFPRMPLRTEE